MSAPVVELELSFEPHGDGYLVRWGPTRIGWVRRCPNNPRVWDAWTTPQRNNFRGQWSTRQLAGRALVRHAPTRQPEIPDEALELLARVLVGHRPPVGSAEWERLHNVVVLPTALAVAHELRLAAAELHDGYPEVASWLEERADELDGGGRR